MSPKEALAKGADCPTHLASTSKTYLLEFCMKHGFNNIDSVWVGNLGDLAETAENRTVLLVTSRNSKHEKRDVTSQEWGQKLKKAKALDIAKNHKMF